MESSLLTGHFDELRIKSIDVDTNGIARVTFDDILSYGTTVLWEDALGDAALSWSGYPAGFFRFPRTKESQVLNVRIASAEEVKAGVADSLNVRSRLLLRPGTVCLEQGERLIDRRIPNPSGSAESSIRIPE